MADFSKMSNEKLTDFIKSKQDKSVSIAPSKFSNMGDDQLLNFINTGRSVMRQSVKEPILETARGFAKGTTGFYGDLAALKVPGASTLRDISKNTERMIPETSMPEVPKAMYQFVGSTVPTLSQFSLTRKLVGTTWLPSLVQKAFGKIPASGQMTDAATIAVQNAVTQFKEHGSSSIPSALAAGAGVSMAFSAGIPIAHSAVLKAIDLTKQFGKTAGAFYLKMVTGNEVLAKDYLSNPQKYDSQIGKKMKSLAEVEEANKLAINREKFGSGLAIEKLSFEQNQQRELLNSKLSEAKFRLSESNRTARLAFQEASKEKIESLRESSSKSFEQIRETLDAKLHLEYEHALQKLETIRSAQGKEVNSAIGAIIEKDPNAAIPILDYLNPIRSVLEKNGLRLEWGKVIPDVGSTTPPSLVKRIQSIVNEVKSVATEDGIPLGFVQKMKQGLQRIAFDGEPSLEKNILKQLSGVLDPARMEGIIGRNISAELNALRGANVKYATLIPRYEEGINLFTRYDAQGKPVADFTKGLRAVQNNDVTALKLIRKADAALPPDDKLLPKLQEVVSETQKAETQMLANISLLRRKLSIERNKLNQSISQKTKDLNKAQRGEKVSQMVRLRQELSRLKSEDKGKLDLLEQELKREEEFIKNIGLLNSLTAGPGTPAKFAQHVAAFSAAMETITAPFGGFSPLKAGLAGGVALGLSPRFARSVVKGGGETLQNLKKLADLMGAIGRNDSVRRVLSIEVAKSSPQKNE